MCVRRRAETGLSRANDYSNVVCGRHNKGSKDSSAAPALPWATDASTGGTVLHARGTQSPQRLWTMYLVKRVLMFSNLFCIQAAHEAAAAVKAGYYSDGGRRINTAGLYIFPIREPQAPPVSLARRPHSTLGCRLKARD